MFFFARQCPDKKIQLYVFKLVFTAIWHVVFITSVEEALLLRLRDIYKLKDILMPHTYVFLDENVMHTKLHIIHFQFSNSILKWPLQTAIDRFSTENVLASSYCEILQLPMTFDSHYRNAVHSHSINDSILLLAFLRQKLIA